MGNTGHHDGPHQRFGPWTVDRNTWTILLSLVKIRPKVLEGFPGQRLTVLPPPALARATSLPVCNHLLPTRIGRFDAAACHFVERAEGAEDHILIGCLGGAGTAQIHSRSWRLRVGHVIVLPPGVYHRYWADTRSPWTIVWAHFRGDLATEYCKALGITIANQRLEIVDIHKIAAAFEEMYRYVLGGYADSDLLGLSISLGRLLGLCRIYQKFPEVRVPRAEDRVLRVIQFMCENVDRNLDLETCARTAGSSRSYFSQAFRRQTNVSPMEFFSRLKMARACEMLTNPEESVQEIANRLGFSDPFYFSRSFRNRLNLSPTQYRKEYLARATGDKE
ncbi:MAG: AraC family transcriptional regulator [Verrucomicrobia bacterium]|nr:AraC family transcriptional regulator [Verrucomicrobiota bacterium]